MTQHSHVVRCPLVVHYCEMTLVCYEQLSETNMESKQSSKPFFFHLVKSFICGFALVCGQP